MRWLFAFRSDHDGELADEAVGPGEPAQRDCDLCRDIAPEFFRRDDDTGQSMVYRQPATPEGVALAQEALEGCPSGSIGDDGMA